MKSPFAFIVFALSFCIIGSSGSRILVSAPFGTKSHQNMFVPLIKELVNRGHDLTVISNYEISELSKSNSVRTIIVKEAALDTEKYPNLFKMALKPDYLEMIKMLYNAFFHEIKESTIKTFENPNVHQLLSDPTEKFDLVLISHAGTLSSLPIAWHFKAPMISMSPNVLLPGIATLLGDDEHDSYVPFLLSSYTDRMTLIERTMNFLSNRVYISLITWHFSTVRSFVAESGIIPNCPPLKDIEKNMSLIFINSHPILSYPRTLSSQVIEVGAMHCRPAKPLPDDLEAFVNSSGDAGFIIFAVGSAIKMDDMPEEILQSFIKAFSRLPQNVIWQWQGKPRKDLPKNVLAVSWLPQQDLLGHKKCRLFITHGGLNSLQEAVYHRVPVLGMPIMSDQTLNLKRAAKDGYAFILQWKDTTEETLTNAFDQILAEDSSYFKAVSRLSILFRDQSETPLERAVYWTEFTIRHNGVKHLRLGSRDLSFIQRNLWDVYLILLSIGITPLILTFFCIRRCCLQRKPKSVIKKKTQ